MKSKIMNPFISIILIVLMVLGLCACSDSNISSSESESVLDGESQTETDSDDALQEEEHSSIFNEKYTVEQVVEYFNEVVLDMEYQNGDGNFQVVQKWTEPIVYRISGDIIDTDLLILQGLFDELNKIEGFPGIREASEYEFANLTLGFYHYDDFYAYMGDVIGYEEADGAVEYFFYNDTNNIYKGRIGYRADINQEDRNPVLLEEVVNGLGIGDSELREDSIVYQWENDVQELSEMDWIIIKLLYSSKIHCGMNAEECKMVIETLYY